MRQGLMQGTFVMHIPKLQCRAGIVKNNIAFMFNMTRCCEHQYCVTHLINAALDLNKTSPLKTSHFEIPHPHNCN